MNIIYFDLLIALYNYNIINHKFDNKIIIITTKFSLQND